ncbi:MAG: nitroreductase family protein, partial [Pseudomonadota bacterium]
SVAADDISRILEAARWAPSSRNGQPWRYIVSQRGNVAFDKIVSAMPESNSQWASRASNLIVAISYEAEPGANAHAQYDVGQSVAYMILQATNLGIATHQIGGFDRTVIKEKFGLDSTLEPMAVVALGYFDEKVELPDNLMQRELGARVRRPLAETILES